MTRRLAALAVALALAFGGLAAPASAAAPKVLAKKPYYLSLHKAEGPALGTVMLLHGGGWKGDLGAGADDVMREWIDRLTGWGWDVANLGYRSGVDSLADVFLALDRVRNRIGPDERLCLFGGSAGAHLALTAAARRGAEVDCVVDLLGPPDLVEWGERPAAQMGRRLAVETFGERHLAELSPINMADQIEPPVLVAATPCDVFIDIAAQERFAEALEAAGNDVTYQVIDEGEDVPLAHCNVEAASFDEFLAVAERFLAGEPTPDAIDDEESGPWLLVALAVVAAVGAGGIAAWRTRGR